MTDTIRIDLDTIRVYRNKSEYRTTQRARSSLGHEIVGDGFIVSKLAAILRKENPQFDGLLEVYRGDNPCFIPTPLKTAFRKGPQPKQLRKEAA
ncbi:hypothetical protein FGK63_01080 [Ruegeria sediminis]|uniref:Uncharacterized protein n=1 Tax=Ruegeria sediminis TaxID=2583820 RepID=A0ABY2X2Y0_9RHOB|nr:hypothetical protein [Ruegeria sediminis]TMV09693.1 hypothetical protein FGK63_01080 [Ruegeria sediminis]